MHTLTHRNSQSHAYTHSHAYPHRYFHSHTHPYIQSCTQLNQGPLHPVTWSVYIPAASITILTLTSLVTLHFLALHLPPAPSYYREICCRRCFPVGPAQELTSLPSPVRLSQGHIQGQNFSWAFHVLTPTSEWASGSVLGAEQGGSSAACQDGLATAPQSGWCVLPRTSPGLLSSRSAVLCIRLLLSYLNFQNFLAEDH